MKDNKIIPIGPYHPFQKEAAFFQLHVEGEKVVKLDINIGYAHRGIEKLSTEKTWNGVTYLVERICGTCSAAHTIAYVSAVENLAGVEPPLRAQYVRTIVGELERLNSHLLWLGLFGYLLGYKNLWMWAWRYREPILDMCELISGNRNHYAMLKIGGVRRDIESDMIPLLKKELSEIENKVQMLTKAVLDDPFMSQRLKEIGVLPKEEAKKYCVVGPVARASGLSIDVRKDETCLPYHKVDWNIIVAKNGDVFDKTKVRLLECLESIKIINQCLDKLPNGDIETEVREIPEGEGIGRYESPRGEEFHYVRSDGSNTPYRHKIRTASFMNIKSNEYAVVGYHVSDALIILASVDPCYACADRIIVIGDGKLNLNFQELLKLSWEKTQRIMSKYKGRL